MQHKVYMTPKLYEKLYHKKAQTTGIYCIEKNISKKKMQENGKQILARDEASTLHFCADDEKTMSDMVNNLNIVVVVLIVSAGLLAFVVLYNLNNINISERKWNLQRSKFLDSMTVKSERMCIERISFNDPWNDRRNYFRNYFTQIRNLHNRSYLMRIWKGRFMCKAIFTVFY